MIHAVNLLTFTYGVANGWPAPILPKLQSDESPLPGEPLTLDEVSWIAANICIGGFIGNIFFGFALDVLGRKKSLLFMALPATVRKKIVNSEARKNKANSSVMITMSYFF